MEIQVLFFGILAELTGSFFKHYSEVNSFADLRHRIEDDFPEIVHYNYRIAINNELIDENPVLKTGDEVAFMPPFEGG